MENRVALIAKIAVAWVLYVLVNLILGVDTSMQVIAGCIFIATFFVVKSIDDAMMIIIMYLKKEKQDG